MKEAVTEPQTKKYLKSHSPGDIRGKDRLSLEPLEGRLLCWHTDFGLLVSTTLERILV